MGWKPVALDLVISSEPGEKLAEMGDGIGCFRLKRSFKILAVERDGKSSHAREQWREMEGGLCGLRLYNYGFNAARLDRFRHLFINSVSVFAGCTCPSWAPNRHSPTYIKRK